MNWHIKLNVISSRQEEGKEEGNVDPPEREKIRKFNALLNMWERRPDQMKLVGLLIQAGHTSIEFINCIKKTAIVTHSELAHPSIYVYS